jgi:hypothetical protein
LTVWWHRPGIVHNDAVGRSGGRFFNVELTWEGTDALAEAGPSRRDFHEHGTRIVWLACRLLRELRHWQPCSALVTENLALEMAGCALRHPERPASPQPVWLGRVVQKLHDEPDRRHYTSALAHEAGVHPVYLASVFRRIYRQPIGEYLRALRVRHAWATEANWPGSEVSPSRSVATASHRWAPDRLPAARYARLSNAHQPDASALIAGGVVDQPGLQPNPAVLRPIQCEQRLRGLGVGDHPVPGGAEPGRRIQLGGVAVAQFGGELKVPCLPCHPGPAAVQAHRGPPVRQRPRTRTDQPVGRGSDQRMNEPQPLDALTQQAGADQLIHRAGYGRLVKPGDLGHQVEVEVVSQHRGRVQDGPLVVAQHRRQPSQLGVSPNKWPVCPLARCRTPCFIGHATIPTVGSDYLAFVGM